MNNTKTVTLEIPNEVVAGCVTIILTAESGFGLEMLTRNFDFQVKNGTSLKFERGEKL